ncbi:MAG: response regulator [Promethearchaeota archaeon]|jgi:CheY-like chemotaxis protein
MSKKIDILLVDDSEDDVFMFTNFFEESNVFNIVQVLSNGEDAVNYLKKKDKYQNSITPDLIVLDINMPIKGGIEVLKEIKMDNSLKNIPVIIHTTSSREEDIIKSYQEGASSYIRKTAGALEMSNMVNIFEKYWTIVSKIPKKSAI